MVLNDAFAEVSWEHFKSHEGVDKEAEEAEEEEGVR